MNHATDEFALANERLAPRFGAAASGDELGTPGGASWLGPSSRSPLFRVFLGGERALSLRLPGALVERVEDGPDDGGVRRVRLHVAFANDGLHVVQHFALYDGSSLFETWQTVRNTGARPVEITRLETLALDLAASPYELFSYTSDWGNEFTGARRPLESGTTLETRRGRSSKDRHPWFALFRPDGSILSASVAWSGNWAFRFETAGDGAVRLSGGLNDWEFGATLGPSESLDSPPVVVALGTGGDLNTVSREYARVGRRHWYPHNALSERLPVEWNHWWPYEDRNIDERVFRANVDAAARLGVEVCTLDAGWFGPPEAGTDWYDYRGDFDDVNTTRFPSGLRALSDNVHERGMAFGLWCEIEALGKRARLAEQRPELVATRGGEPLGYVCFGSPDGQEWAFDALSRLVTDYRLDWIKLDFNLDPGAGCDRCDHGHGASDGLYAHYQGYNATLERLREAHPDVVLENCASGGLRIDLGILCRTVPTFLSDPDWPEHGLQLVWGASTMMAPCAWLHWGFSEWINSHPEQNFNPRDPALKPHQLDYYVRIGMLGAFGLSQKLPDLPTWAAERYAGHIALYKTTLRRFVRDADFYRLTGQPLHEGRGDRWAAFQYVLGNGDEHLVAAFRLPGGETERTLEFYDLDPDREYTLTWLQTDRTEHRRGADLIAHGLRCDGLEERDSRLVLLR